MGFLIVWLEVVALAVVQGIGEFLPISSSGHLVVGAALCDQWGYPIQEKLTLNVALHVGTLFAVVVFFRRRLLELVGKDCWGVALVGWATIPAAVVGLGLKIQAQQLLESPLLAGVAFLITGLALLATRKIPPGQRRWTQLGLREAFWIGLAQALALLPGISRSGLTIVAGLALGLLPAEAATFSFLLAIPVIAGAGMLETLQLLHQPCPSAPWSELLLGMALSFLVGWAALGWLVQWLQRGRLYWFAYWLFTIGPLVILWQILQNG